MNRARFLPAALAALGSCCALAGEVIIGPTKDNTLFSSDAVFGGNTSDGAGPRMYVGQTNGAGSRRALIAFDIASAVPAGASIDGVSLSFNVSSFHGFQTITVHRLLQDWGEGDSNSGLPGGGGAPAQDGDATWNFHHFFSDGSSQPWTTPGGDFVPTQSASGNAAATTFVLSSPQMAGDVAMWRDTPATNFGWILIGDEGLFGAADRLDSKENSDPNARPRLTIDYSMPGPPQWNNDADGSWNNAANWSSNSIPNAPDAAVALSDKITAPRTITLDAPITIGTITISSFNRYTIAAGLGGSLTLGGPGAPGAININPATHVISAPLIVAAPSTINVPGDGKLILSGGLQINNAAPLLMTGDGQLTLSGPQTHQNGASLTINNISLEMDSNAGAPAFAGPPAIGNSLSAATAASAPLSITLSGGPGVFLSILRLGASQDLNSLTINSADEGTQYVDLNSTQTAFNNLRIHGGDLGAAKVSLNAAIQQAKTTGEGIIDSGLHAGAAIGIATLTDANGDPYVLIRPTRIGDLNLDGAVTISDFIDLASHFNAPGDWQAGDLNGDGTVTISDFIDLASNFNTAYTGASTPISPADQSMLDTFATAHSVTLVPEPGLAGLIFAGATMLARRRRK